MSVPSRFSYDYLMKFIIIGDSGVGKTCLLKRFAEDTFTTSHISTIGIDFIIKLVNIKDKTIKLQIWDTAGQDRFRTITQSYYKNAMGIILVYDCTVENSFDNIRNWMKQIETHADHNVVKVLVGNKSDANNKKVDGSCGEELSKEFEMKFFETSAKDKINVDETFDYLIKETMNKVRPVVASNKGVKLERKEKKSSPITICC